MARELVISHERQPVPRLSLASYFFIFEGYDFTPHDIFIRDIVLTLGDPERVAEILPAQYAAFDEESWAWRDNMRAYAQDLLDRLDDSRRIAYSAHAVRLLHHEIEFYTRFLGESHYVDATVGGIYRGRLAAPICRADGSAFLRQARSLATRRSARRYSRSGLDAKNEVDFASRIIKDFGLPSDLSFGDQVVDAVRDAVSYAISEVKKIKQKVIVDRQTRKSLLRAAKLAHHVVGRASAERFTRRDPVVLVGRRFLWQTHAPVLSAVGHGALSISLLDHSGQRLANICVYFPETPAIDQFVALHALLSCQEEDSLLSSGNLYNISPLGKKSKDILMFSQDLRHPDKTAILRTLNESIAEEYANAHLSMYREIVETTVWGRDVFRYRRLIKSDTGTVSVSDLIDEYRRLDNVLLHQRVVRMAA